MHIEYCESSSAYRLGAIPFIRGLGEWIKPVRSKRTGVSQPPQVRILYPLPLESWQSLAYCTRLEVVKGLQNPSEVQILHSPPILTECGQRGMAPVLGTGISCDFEHHHSDHFRGGVLVSTGIRNTRCNPTTEHQSLK